MTIGSWIRRLGPHHHGEPGGLNRDEVAELVANMGRVPQGPTVAAPRSSSVKRGRTVSGPSASSQYRRPAPRQVVVNKKQVKASRSIPYNLSEPQLLEVPRAPKSVFETGIALPDERERLPPAQNPYLSYRASQGGAASVIPLEDMEAESVDEDNASSIEQGVLPYELDPSYARESRSPAPEDKSTDASVAQAPADVPETESDMPRNARTAQSQSNVPSTEGTADRYKPTTYSLGPTAPAGHGKEPARAVQNVPSSLDHHDAAQGNEVKAKGKESEHRVKGETKFTEAIRSAETKKEPSKATESAKTLEPAKTAEPEAGKPPSGASHTHTIASPRTAAKVQKPPADTTDPEYRPPVPPKDVKPDVKSEKPSTTYTPSYLTGTPVAPKSDLPLYLRTGKVSDVGNLAGTAKATEAKAGNVEAKAAAEKAAAEKKATEKVAAEKAAAQRAAEEKAAAEKAAKEKKAAEEKAAAEKKAAKEQKAEEQRKAAEKQKAAEEKRKAEEKKAAEEKAAAEKKAAEERKAAEKKVAEEKAAEERRAAERKAAEEKAAEERRAAERKAAEEKAAEERRAAERKATEEKAAEERRAAERKAAEEKAAEERRAAERKAAEEKKASEEKAAAEKAAEERRAAERKAAEEKAAEKRKAAEKTAAERAKSESMPKTSAQPVTSTPSFSTPSDRTKPAPAISGLNSFYNMPKTSTTLPHSSVSSEAKPVTNEQQKHLPYQAHVAGAAPALSYASIYGAAKPAAKAETPAEPKPIKSVLPDGMRQNSFDTSVSTRAFPPESRRNSDDSTRASIQEAPKSVTSLSGLAPAITDASSLGLSKTERPVNEKGDENKSRTIAYKASESRASDAHATKAVTAPSVKQNEPVQLRKPTEAQPAVTQPPFVGGRKVSEPLSELKPRATLETKSTIQPAASKPESSVRPDEAKPAAAHTPTPKPAEPKLEAPKPVPSAKGAPPAPKPTETAKPAESAKGASAPAAKPTEPTNATTATPKPAEGAKEAPSAEATRDAKAAASQPAEAAKDAKSAASKPAEAAKDAKSAASKPAEDAKDAKSAASKPAEDAKDVKSAASKPAEATKAGASAKPAEAVKDAKSTSKPSEAPKAEAEAAEETKKRSPSILAALRRKDKKMNKHKKK